MPPEILSREQRIRKQAELQSLYTALANLREREASYMAASAKIPAAVIGQIHDVQHNIEEIENQLFEAEERSSDASSRKVYRAALAAELSGDYDGAAKLYRSAARYGHRDGNAAVRSVRYKLKATKTTPVTDQAWVLPKTDHAASMLWLGLMIIVILLLIVVVAYNFASSEPQVVVVVSPAFTATATPTVVQVIIAQTPTRQPSPTLTSTPSPASQPQVVEVAPTATTFTIPPVEETPTPVPVLLSAPTMIEPRDGLVWNNGAVVFEFKPLDLAEDELYCLSTLRGYDANKAENWSHTAEGSQTPAIAVEANVFKVARDSGMRCITWSAAIGKNSCDNIISYFTPVRVIGLPTPCDF